MPQTLSIESHPIGLLKNSLNGKKSNKIDHSIVLEHVFAQGFEALRLFNWTMGPRPMNASFPPWLNKTPLVATKLNKNSFLISTITSYINPLHCLH